MLPCALSMAGLKSDSHPSAIAGADTAAYLEQDINALNGKHTAIEEKHKGLTEGWPQGSEVRLVLCHLQPMRQHLRLTTLSCSGVPGIA